MHRHPDGAAGMSSTEVPGPGAVGAPVADPDAARYRSVAHRLYEIAKPIRVLAALRWPASAREEFLAGGGAALPAVDYPSFDE